MSILKSNKLFLIFIFIMSLLISGFFNSQEAFAADSCSRPNSKIVKNTKPEVGGVAANMYDYCETGYKNYKARTSNASAVDKAFKELIAKLPKEQKSNDKVKKAYRKHYESLISGVFSGGAFDAKQLEKLNKSFPDFLKKEAGVVIDPESVSKSKEHMSGQLIAAPGIFTSGFYEDVYTCYYYESQTNKIHEKNEGAEKDPAPLSEAIEPSTVNNDKGTTAVAALGKGVAEGFVSPDVGEGKTSTGIYGVNCSDYSVLKNISKLYDPVNITSSKAVMTVVYTFQLASIALGVLLTAIFGLYYMTGNETTDPFKFVIRAFLVMMVVYYLPYFAQDILNVNNMLTYYIGQESLGVSGETATAGGFIAIFASMSMVLTMSAAIFAFGPAVGAMILVGLIILLFIFVLFIRPILTLIFWWYFRLVMIIFLVVLGPLFITMMILPKTEAFGKKWLMSFIGETFTQTLMVVAVYFAGEILKDTVQLRADFNMGFLGLLIFVYGVILLLAKIPNIAKSLVGGGIDGIGWNDAMSAGRAVTEFAKNATMATAGALAGKALQNQLANAGAEKADVASQLSELRKNGPLTSEDTNRAEALKNNLEKATDKMDKIGQNEKRFKNAQNFLGNVKSGSFSGGVDTGLQRGHEEIDKELSEESSDRMLENAETKAKKQMKKYANKDAVQREVDGEKNKARNELNRRNKDIDDNNLLTDNEKNDQKAAAQAEFKNKMEYWDNESKPENIADEVGKRKKEVENQLRDDVARGMSANKKFNNALSRSIAADKKFDEITGRINKKADESESPNANPNAVKDAPFEKIPNQEQFQNNSVEKMLTDKNVDENQKNKISKDTGNLIASQQKLDRTTAQARGTIADNVQTAAQNTGKTMDRAEALQKADQFLQAYGKGDEAGMKAVSEFTNSSTGETKSAYDASKSASVGVQTANASLTKAVDQFVNRTNGVLGNEGAQKAAQEIQVGASVMQGINSANSTPSVNQSIKSSIATGQPVDSQAIVQATTTQMESLGYSGEAVTKLAEQNVQMVQQAVGTVRDTVQSVTSGASGNASWNDLQTKVESNLQSAGFSGEVARVNAQQTVSAVQDKNYQVYADSQEVFNSISGSPVSVMSKPDYIQASSATGIQTNVGGISRNDSAQVLTSKGQEIIVQQIAEGKSVDAGFVSSQIGAGDRDLTASVSSFASGVQEMVANAQINAISTPSENGDISQQVKIAESFANNRVSYDEVKGTPTGGFNKVVDLIVKEMEVAPEIAQNYVNLAAKANASGVTGYDDFNFPRVDDIIPQQIKEMVITDTVEGKEGLTSFAFQSPHIPIEVEKVLAEHQKQVAQAYRAVQNKEKEKNE